MSNRGDLFNQSLNVINLGLESFARDLDGLGVPVVDVDWSPPAGGDLDRMEMLATLLEHEESIHRANRKTLERMFEARPIWVDVAPARELLSGLGERELLHAGPSVSWDRMCGPQRRGVMGACVFEDWASDFEQAEAMASRGELTLTPSHEYNVVGPMATVVSPSMPLIVVEDEHGEQRAFSTINEGRGNVQWFGVMNQEVLDHLNWIRSVLGPSLRQAIRTREEGLPLLEAVAQGLLMGDECHVRAGATTSQLLQRLVPPLIESDVNRSTAAEVVRWIAGNTLFSLNFTMAACKVCAERAHGVKGSTVVTGMTRNGVEFALRVGGMDRWFTAPAPRMDEAIYYSGYGVEDSTGDIGDSSILEVVGLGGMAIAAAPTVADFVGGDVSDQLRETRRLRDITLESHPDFQIPNLNQTGSPVGMDLRAVVETGTVPFIDSGVVHEQEWEVGQVGAGVVRAPIDCFHAALQAYVESGSLPPD